MPSNKLVFLGADICLANFRGEERRSKRTGEVVNAAGDRNFCIKLTPEKARELKLEGWNIKPYFSAGNTDRVVPDFEYLPVAIRFEPYPPKVFMVSGHKKTDLGEDTIGLLQGREFENIDLVISGSRWERGGRTGIKAYLFKGGFTLLLDEFDQKYDYLEDDGNLPPFEMEDGDQASNW